MRAEVRHRMPGRLRIVLDPPPAATDSLKWLAERLVALPGVDSVEARPSTASIIVRCADEAAVLDALAGLDIVLAREAPDNAPQDVLQETAQRILALDATLLRRTAGRLDLRSLAFVGLVAGGLVQLARGQIAGPALTLFAQAATLALTRRLERPD